MSNIHTLPGRAPPVREVPAFKPKLRGDETEVLELETVRDSVLWIEREVEKLRKTEPSINVVMFLLGLVDKIQKSEGIQA